MSPGSCDVANEFPDIKVCYSPTLQENVKSYGQNNRYIITTSSFIFLCSFEWTNLEGDTFFGKFFDRFPSGGFTQELSLNPQDSLQIIEYLEVIV